MNVTNIDVGQVEIRGGHFADARLWFGAPGEVKAGTILARATEVAEVDTEVTVTADGGNTGDGTVSAIVVSTAEAVVGEYTLTCTAEEGNGGTFELRNPDGTLIGTLVMDAGAGASTVFTVGGLQITITDGSEDFDEGDTFTLEVETTGDERNDLLVPFAPAGTDGHNVPRYVLTYDVPSSTEQNVSVEADSGNTGDGTVTATLTETLESLGAYRLVCTATETNGGTFSLHAPDGEELADDLELDAEAGSTVFHVAGFRIVITDGDVDFASDDEFVLLVQETLAIKSVRVLQSGEVARERLVIHEDGDGSNVTPVIRDALRGVGIVATPRKQLSQLDNQ